MSYREPQTPGINVGQNELSAAELAGVQNLFGLAFAQGDILYYNGTTLTRLAASTNGFFLKTQGAGANPVWASAAAASQTPWTSDIDGDGFTLYDLGDIRPRTGSAIQSGTTATNTLLIQAYDVNGAAYTTFGTLTSANDPTFELDNTILDTAVAKGTWTASGTWTIPAVTLGGNVASNGKSFTGTIADLGIVTTIDLNGGTIDGVTIGGSSAGAITGTAITGTSFVIGANTLDTNEWAFLDGQNQAVASTSSPTFVNLTITSFAANWTNAGRTVADMGIVSTIDINGGTIDGTVIGASSAAAISATTISASGNLSVNGTTRLATSLTGVLRADSGTVSTDTDVTDIVAAASTSAAGKVELAITSEIDTGTDSTRAMPVDQFVASTRNVRYILFRVIEKATDWSADGTTAVGGDLVIPFTGTIVDIEADVDTAGTTGTAIVDVNLNGSTIMTTNKLKWDSTEKSTRTYSGTAPGLTTTAVTAGDIITCDLDTNHTTKSKGLTLFLAIRLT